MTNILGFFFGLRKLACALTDSEQTPHEEKRQQAAALQRAQWTIVLVAAGLLCVHLWFHSSFWLRCSPGQLQQGNSLPRKTEFRLTRPLAAGSNLADLQRRN